MALIFSESFERTRSTLTDRPKWNLVGGTNLQYTTSSPRTGLQAGSPGFNQLFSRQVRSAEEHATFILGVAVRSVASGDKALCVLTSDAGATTHVYAVIESTGAIAVYRGALGTLLGRTATGVIHVAVGSYQFVEIKAKLDDSTGTIDVHVDEVSVLSLSGVDTKNGGTKTVFDSIGVRNNDEIEDVYLCNGAGSINNDFRGNRRVEQLQPSGNGASSGMTNSAGTSTNNYSYVNDSTGSRSPQPSTYVDGINTGDKDTYAFGDSSQPTGNAVDGIIVWAWAQKTDAGARGLTAVARLSGVESTAAMLPNTVTDTGLVNGVYDWHYAVFETKPGGGSWTVADVNNAEFGLQAS